MEGEEEGFVAGAGMEEGKGGGAIFPAAGCTPLLPERSPRRSYLARIHRPCAPPLVATPREK